MHLQLFLLILISLMLSVQGLSQPVPCNDPPHMESFCVDACIICDIDGFTGRHDANIVGQAPPGFAGECTFVAHNMQWIAFIAGSVDLSVEMAVSNCDLNLGLEFGLYKGENCENFERISNCFGGAAGTIVEPGQSEVITNIEPLVIGQYYFIVMDGALEDNCNWTLSVINGSTLVDPLTTSGVIQGDNSVCPELLHQYFVDPPEGATIFEWTLNGSTIGTDSPELEHMFTLEGTQTLCVTAKNACDEAPSSCMQITVASIPLTELSDILCEGETYDIAGETVNAGGFYQFDLISAEGCDSIVTLDLIEIPTPTLNLDLNICDGDTLFIGSTPYTQTGMYQEVLTSVFDCDSIVNLDLNTIICNITSNNLIDPVICFGESSGQISFEVINGTPPFFYMWEELNGALNGGGNIANTGLPEIIDNLPAGTYIITVADTFGNTDIIIAEVSQPLLLEVELIPSDYNGVNVNCADGNDGSLEAVPSGGVPQYSYEWSNGQQVNLLDQIGPGLYDLTLTDAVGCIVESSYELTSPEELVLIAEFRNPDCGGFETGVVTAVQALGGVGGYTYRLNGGTFTSDQVYSDLTEGIYTVTVMDANGCTAEVSDQLITPEIPIVDLGDDFEISLGEQVDFRPTINDINIQFINWLSTESMSCINCLEPTVVPLNSGMYTISVTSNDGCTDVDSVFITVNKFRKLFVPNIFTPNFDGVNDYFTVYSGPEVELIQKLTVFNRWGGVVFEGINLPAGELNAGWNGTFKGKDANPDVYTWVAEVAFIDGEVLTYSGDVALVK